MTELLHHAREAESHLAEESRLKSKFLPTSKYSLRLIPPSPSPSLPAAPAASQFGNSSSKPAPQSSFGSQAKKPAAPAPSSGSNVSIGRASDAKFHTCGGRSHFK